ncbi:flavin reductase family protein [Hymenobacter weizhouensis]|uniref:flavin reductase family protein n=1 Tax=Hymenobacter sp. YIM 151500-1 TaxID=2987689 RepID=UPI0022263634|nr:flavin reductase family protein [Hymenobacter sp. YIM 151500-1]UYZ64080.1 flavin reductase family protein [Hymenobacter sp. YIM 151500-1]
MPHFTAAELPQLDTIFRLNLINSITGYKPANLVGTAGPDGTLNLAIVSSVVHLGSNPALIGFVMRPTSVARHTYENIRATRLYTLNHVHAGIMGPAHFTSANFPREVSEFAACGLTPETLAGFGAPYVRESRIKIGLELLQELPIEANGTILLIGSVQQVHLPDEVLRPDGSLNLDAAETVCVSGLDGYHAARLLARYDYARPDDSGARPLPAAS